MPSKPTKGIYNSNRKIAGREVNVRVSLKALEIPPIKDAVIIGHDAAIGGEAMARILRLMSTEKFERFALRDEVVVEYVVRTSILRKIGEERLTKFILKHVKPLMTPTEVLLMNVEVELLVEASL